MDNIQVLKLTTGRSRGDLSEIFAAADHARLFCDFLLVALCIVMGQGLLQFFSGRHVLVLLSIATAIIAICVYRYVWIHRSVNNSIAMITLFATIAAVAVQRSISGPSTGIDLLAVPIILLFSLFLLGSAGGLYTAYVAGVFLLAATWNSEFLHYHVQLPDPELRWKESLVAVIFGLALCSLALSSLYRRTRDVIFGVRNRLQVTTQRCDQRAILLGTVVHDVATPLSTILGASASMEHSHDPAEVADIATCIRRNAEKISTMVKAVRSMEFGAHDELSIEPVSISVVDCILDAIELVKPRAESKSLHIVLAADRTARTCRILGQSTILTHNIVENLLSNSIKFSHPGSEIEVSVIAAGLESVEIVIQDYGIGIPAEELASLFDTVELRSRAGTFNEIGTGIGLSICKTFVSLLNGTIAVTSQTSASGGTSGTRVTLRFPRMDQAVSLDERG